METHVLPRKKLLIGITFSKQERNIIGWETLSL
jgi:hypothetical protein